MRVEYFNPVFRWEFTCGTDLGIDVRVGSGFRGISVTLDTVVVGGKKGSVLLKHFQQSDKKFATPWMVRISIQF